jgi:hypothetical protein
MYEHYSRGGLPTWIIGPPISGPWRLLERPALVLKVWPERAPLERLTPDALEQLLAPLRQHCG